MGKTRLTAGLLLCSVALACGRQGKRSAKEIVNDREVTEIATSQDPEELESLVAKVGRRAEEGIAEADLTVAEKWRERRPTTPEEFAEYLADSKRELRTKIAEAAANGDEEQAQAFALSLQALEIYEGLQFEGVDADGRPILTVPSTVASADSDDDVNEETPDVEGEDEEDSEDADDEDTEEEEGGEADDGEGDDESSKDENKDVSPDPTLVTGEDPLELEDARPPKEETDRSVMSLGGVPNLTETESSQAELLETGLATLPFYQPLPGYAERIHGIPEYGDRLLDNTDENVIQNWFDKIIATWSSLEGTSTSNSHIHHQNLKMVNRTLEDAREHPERFGMTGKQILDVTDLDLSVYFERIMRRQALERAITGAVLAAGVDVLLATWLADARVSFSWYAVQAIGPEPILTAIGAYSGAKKMYLLHRYYSYMIGQKTAREIEGEPFDPQAMTLGFDPEQVALAQGFKKQMYSNFAVGTILGGILRGVINPNTVTALYKKTLAPLFMRASASYLIPVASEAALRGGLANGMFRAFGGAVTEIMTSPNVGSMLSSFFPFLKTPLSMLRKVPLVGDIIHKTILTQAPAAVAMIGANAGITAVSMYSVLYSQLAVTAELLNGVYISPGVNVSLAVSAHTKKDSQHFRHTTEAVMFPMCALLIHAPYSQGTLLKEELEARREGCLYLVRELEGFESNAVIQEKFPDIWHDLNIGRVDLTAKEVQERLDALAKIAASYPAQYRTLWLAGLRSIYKISRIPSLYWEIERKVLYGGDTRMGWVNPYSAGHLNLLNLERFEYIVDKLAVDMYMRERDIDAVDAVSKDAEIRGYKAYLAYFRFHHHLTVENKEIIEEIDTGLRNQNGIAAAVGQYFQQLESQFRWVWMRHQTSPAETTPEYTAEQEVEAILSESEVDEEAS